MEGFVINALLLVFLAIIAIAALRRKRLFGMVMLSGAFSLVAPTLFVVLDAVDVAFTEAAVGAGISTVLALATLSLVPAEEKPHSISIGAAIVALATGLLLFAAVSDLPEFGAPDAPVHVYLAPDFIEGSRTDIGVPNVVTSVLASYRGFDTFGETLVVFTAAIGVLLILGGWTRPQKAKGKNPEDDHAG
jgi:multicomponent Na+:H+ antiporter subunit B